MKKAAFWLGILICFAGMELLYAAAPVIQNGSTVAFHYALTVDGRVVNSSQGKQPLTYVQGMGQIIPGLEEQLQGLKRGDKRRIIVPPAKAYGHVDQDAYQNLPRKSFRNAKALKVGSIVNGEFGGKPVQATVLAINDGMVTLDLNHPLAGKTLQFDIEVVDVRP